MDEGEIKKLTVTLVFLHKPPHILLGLKKRGFATGRWNGYGGKVEPGESIEEGAKREMFEESGIRVTEMEPVGFIHFDLLGRPFSMDTHIFRVVAHEGEPIETDEMRPQWFHTDEIPYSEMWADDPVWLPLMLQGKRFEGNFVMDENDALAKHELKIIE